MSGLGQYLIDKITGRKAAPDLVTTPAAPDWQPITFLPRHTVEVDCNSGERRVLPAAPPAAPASDDAEEGDGAGAKRFAHGRIVVDGTLYLVRFDRQTCDLNIRKAFARSGCTFYGPELVKHAQRMKGGAIGI